MVVQVTIQVPVQMASQIKIMVKQRLISGLLLLKFLEIVHGQGTLLIIPELAVDGSGSQTFQLSDDPGTVAVTFQKDNSNEVSQNGTVTPNTGTLTVQILDKTGKVVATQSTTADAGVVNTSYSF
ncbi:MAG: hypothetical protein NKF70_10140 [Methanobacterium sp. ERen5]|nr:MAG: hypothetical protein NKF70_10140 [Methanobacterium sp. ERen5]